MVGIDMCPYINGNIFHYCASRFISDVEVHIRAVIPPICEIVLGAVFYPGLRQHPPDPCLRQRSVIAGSLLRLPADGHFLTGCLAAVRDIRDITGRNGRIALRFF